MGKLDSILGYNTVKIVKINNWKLGLVHYSVMLAVLLYVLGFVILYKKGYQASDTLIGEATIKIKGNAFVNTSSGIIIWDAEDSVFPPLENSAFFLTTNYWNTTGQKRDVCGGDTYCNNTTPCAPFPKSIGSGISNGTCDYSTSSCFIYAWCPVEQEPNVVTNYLQGIEDFTVFIKVNVKFPTFNIYKNNLEGDALTKNYNLFAIKDILQSAGTSMQEIKADGAIILIDIIWNCDFDGKDDCKPQFTFQRIDTESELSKGFNYRYAHYYWMETGTTATEYRDIYKVYGARFLISVSGVGKKFDIVPLVVNIASGLALLSVSTVVTDLIALYVHPMKKQYTDSKFENVDNAPEGEEKPLIVNKNI